MEPKTFLFFFVTTALILNLPGYGTNNAAAINVSDQQPMADNEEPDEPFTDIPNMTILYGPESATHGIEQLSTVVKHGTSLWNFFTKIVHQPSWQMEYILCRIMTICQK